MEEFYSLYEDTMKWFDDKYLQIELCREVKGSVASLGFVKEIRLRKGHIEYETINGCLSIEAWKIHLKSEFEEFLEFETELYKYRCFGYTEYSAKGVINEVDDFAESEDVWSLSFYQTHQKCFPFENTKSKIRSAK
ncbi:hypothetical protein ABEH28_13175 [Pseudomonas sp. Ps21-P2]|uniref:hypothetical protein n=1 Tax=Pseudomonas sp. Ps21-P2 TaxID=3080331 RepID=UPI003207D67A